MRGKVEEGSASGGGDLVKKKGAWGEPRPGNVCITTGVAGGVHEAPKGVQKKGEDSQRQNQFRKKKSIFCTNKPRKEN